MRAYKTLVLTILILLALPFCAVAGGNPEMGLPKVDRLIKERNYNAAILELAAYIQENPEDFDGAQQRIRRIIKLREDYNEKADELLGVLVNDPTNDQKKLEMIAYLESLEKNPNASTQAFIADTKAAAQFTYYRAKFDEILTVGDSLIDSGSYVAAVNKFVEGYVFYKQEFDEANDNELVTGVNRSLSSITTSLLSFTALQEEFNTAAASCAQALSDSDLALADTAFPRMLAAVDSLARARNAVAEAGWFFEDTFAQMQIDDSNLTENSFLPFAQRFTLGRKTAGRYEGVLGAMDAQWVGMARNLDSLARSRLLAYWKGGDPLDSAASAASVSASLADAVRLSSVMEGFFTALAEIPVRVDTWGVPAYNTLAASYRDTGAYASSYSSLDDTYFAWQALRSPSADWAAAEPQSGAIRSGTDQFIAGSDSVLDGLVGIVARTEGIRSGIAGLSPFEGYAESYESLESTLLDGVSSDSLAWWQRKGSYLETSSTLVYEGRKAEYDKAVALLDGTSAGGDLLVYFPTESVAAFNSLRSGITADRRALLAAVELLAAAPSAVRSDTAYAQSSQGITANAEKLDSLTALASEGIAKANTRILQANLARQEADLRYSQALAALNQNNFQIARDNLQRSRDKYNQSLSWQESVALRGDTDKKLEKLGSDITRIENETVVREVRVLISSGKNFYYQGNIDQAEQVFNQAKTRWSVTNVDPNAEITNWLDIIKTALSMKTGRTIPVSDPLYPQMSQLLNGVNLQYANGAALMKAGSRTAALTVLTDAKMKLQQLKLVYPLNQDAGLLTLMIDQLIDPESFRENFRQKLSDIRANYKTRKQESYTELLDLYQMNPSYPGIKTLLYDVEIYLGIRIPPPDPAAIRRSDQLTASAKKIYDSSARSQFDQARLQLEEAIKLNPDNQSAILLIDRIATASGGSGTAVLSGADEQKYQQAVQELQKGNTINAAALVEQLLQNAKNRNSSKILDLKKRIDSLL